MTDLKKAAQQALEALEKTHTQPGCEQWQAERKASVALRAALAQQEQEPVAWQWLNTAHFRKNLPVNAESGAWNPLYTRPHRREWRGLTMQEINALPEVGGRMWNMGVADAVLRAIRAIETKLKEKNQ
jgi:hypothetical protein